MKSVFKNTVSISLAFLVLFSSTSFAITHHFCGTELIDVSVFGNSSSCFSSSTTPQEVQCLTSSCCSDSVVGVDRSDLLLHSIDIEFDKVIFFTNNLHLIFQSVFEDFKTLSLDKYSPPKLTMNLLVVFEVFLI